MPSVVGLLKRSIKWIEFAYVIVLVCALTQGPVLKIWWASAMSTDTSLSETYRLTFVAVQIPGLIMLGYRIQTSRLRMLPVVLLAGFVSWMWMSTLWATSGRDTVVEATTLVITAATGLYLARSFSLVQQMILVCIAMQPGVIFSYLAVKRNWELAITEEGHWVGIYFNRNSLAPVAAVGMLAALGLLWVVVSRRYKQWWPVMSFILLDIALLNGYVLWRTGSSTSVGAIVAFGLVWLCWSVIRLIHRRGILTIDQVRRYVYSSFVGLAGAGMWILFTFQSTILKWLGEEEFFNGRAAIWHYGWTGFLDRPIIGWGWMSAWKSNTFLQRDLWWTVQGAQFSHSTYIDVLLGGGLIGAVLFLLVLVCGGHSQIESGLLAPAGQWSFSILFFVLLASTQESFASGNHFLLLLLVSSVIGCNAATVESKADTVTALQEATT